MRQQSLAAQAASEKCRRKVAAGVVLGEMKQVTRLAELGALAEGHSIRAGYGCKRLPGPL
jgi:hypothetical protein